MTTCKALLSLSNCLPNISAIKHNMQCQYSTCLTTNKGEILTLQFLSCPFLFKCTKQEGNGQHIILNFSHHSHEITFHADMKVLTPWQGDACPFLFLGPSFAVVEIPPPPWGMVEVSPPPLGTIA